MKVISRMRNSSIGSATVIFLRFESHQIRHFTRVEHVYCWLSIHWFLCSSIQSCFVTMNRTRRAFHQTSSVWSLLASSLKMVAPSAITTSRKSRPYTWSFVCEVACKYLSRRWQARPSLLRWSQATLSRTWRPRFRYTCYRSYPLYALSPCSLLQARFIWPVLTA